MGNDFCCNPDKSDANDESFKKLLYEKKPTDAPGEPSKPDKPDSVPVPEPDPIPDPDDEFTEEEILKAFEHSVEQKKYKNAMLIIETRPNINFINHTFKKSGFKPIHMATQQKNSVFLTYLFMKGCDANLKTEKYQETALHIATKNEDVRMMTVLLYHGASINIENKLGQTPKDFALKTKNEEIIGIFDESFLNWLTSPDGQESREQDPNGYKPVINKEPNIIGLIDSPILINTKKDDLNIINNKNTGDIYVPTPNDIEKYLSGEYSDDNTGDDDDNKVNVGKIKDVFGEDIDVNLLKRDIVKNVSQLRESKKQLTALGCWLKKKSKLGKWNDRYLCVIDGHLIWHHDKIQINPNTKLNFTELKKYRTSFNLLTLKYIRKVDEKQFEICGPDKRSKKPGASRKYEWKCVNKQLRDKLVESINKHSELLETQPNVFDSIYVADRTKR